SGTGISGGGTSGSSSSSGEGGGVERLAYAADWLVGGWPQRGALGYWDPELTNGRAKQVFGHLVRAPGPTTVGKDAVRMQYGEYDWDLAALSAGGPYAFLGSPNASEPPRVLALLPQVDTSVQGLAHWSNTVRGLVQVALLTGRRVVWPSVPCSSPWALPNPGSRRGLPLNVNLKFLAHGSFSEGLMCTPAVVFHQKCLYERHVVVRNEGGGEGAGGGGGGGAAAASNNTEVEEGGGGPDYTVRVEGPRGLLPGEFVRLLQLLPAAEGAPGPHNTVHLATNDDYEDDSEDRPVMFDEPPRTPGIAYLKAASVASALRSGPLAAQPVLYLAQRTFLTQLDKLGEPELLGRYRTFRNECPALK
ncbi:hypothetical protein Agub_g602, partial [Astrephomene gubernaculifera]